MKLRRCAALGGIVAAAVVLAMCCVTITEQRRELQLVRRRLLALEERQAWQGDETRAAATHVSPSRRGLKSVTMGSDTLSHTASAAGTNLAFQTVEDVEFSIAGTVEASITTGTVSVTNDLHVDGGIGTSIHADVINIDSSGHVNFGSTSHSASYNPTFNFKGGTGEYPMIIDSNQQYALGITYQSSPSEMHWLAEDSSGNFHIHEDNGGDRLTIQDSTGYVGIAQTTPTVMLDVNGDFKVSGGINAAGLPTASAGLSTGDVYNDAGTLRVA